VTRRHLVAALVVATAHPLLLGHAGEGATWQAMLVVVALGLVTVFGLALVGKLELSRPDDLVLPLAGVAIASALAPLGAPILSDWVGWAFPVGVVALVAMVLAVLTPLDLEVTSPLSYGAAGMAVVAALLLHEPLTIAWHPPPDFLPLVDDVEVAITDPADGDDVDAGEVSVTVQVAGGSIGPGLLPVEELPDDPEEAGSLAVAVDGDLVDVEYAETCTVEEPCTSVSFPLELDGGRHDLAVEFRRGDGASLTPLVTDRIAVTAR
jgi:hypothetical protein